MFIVNISSITPEFSEKLRSILEGIAVVGRDARGEVSVSMDGTYIVTGVNISESLLRPSERQVLEGLLVAAYRDAHDKVQQALVEQMSKLTEAR
jgi:hypothetical protein